MNSKKLVPTLSLILVALCAWLSLANDHKFARKGGAQAKVSPAPIDLNLPKNYQTATFGLG